MKQKKHKTIREVHDLFIADRIARGLSKESIRGYRSLLKPFMDHFPEEKAIESLTDAEVRDFEKAIVGRYHNKEISKNYVASVFRNVKILLRWWSDERKGRVQYNWRKIHTVHSTKKAFNTYTPEQIKQIFDAADSPIPWIGARNRAILAIGIDSGLRRAEIANLTRDEYLTNGKSIGMLHVLGKGSKERFVPIGEMTRGLIDDYLDQCPMDSEWLFIGVRGEQLRLNSYCTIMKNISNECGFPVTMHLMRHHFATDYLNESYKRNSRMDAHGLRALLGHTTFMTTDMYIHTVVSKLAATQNLSAIDRIFALHVENNKKDEILDILMEDDSEK